MAGNLTAMIAAIFSGSAVSTDPYFNLTTLLLSTTATNGQQNNTFQDSSTNNFTITRNPATGPNAPTQGTFSPFSQTGWGNYFNGSSQYLSTPDNAAFTLGSGDFTVEVWVYKTTTGTVRTISSQCGSSGANTSASYILQVDASEKVVGSINSGATNYAATSSGNCPLNAWTHIALARDGNTLRLYINGIQDGTASVTGVTVNDSSDILGIGSLGAYTSLYWSGYISNFRLVKGRCVYPSGTTFNPPTSPLTRTTGGTNPPQGTECSLLTCQSNRFLDSNGVNTPASSPLTITPNGSPTVVAFSPFNPTASWSAATNGGSGYFDGSGDYLTASSTIIPTTGDVTIETWLYPTVAQVSTVAYMAGAGASSDFLLYYNSSGAIGVETGNVFRETATGLILLNTWQHLAITKSGSTYKIFLNGTEVTFTGAALAGTLTQSTLNIGGLGAANNFAGYFSNFRITQSIVYTANFTPPTAPLTAITNTSLLLNFTNAGIYDATAKNVLETVGNAQVSTTQSKWSPTSMYFDGTGDWLLSTPNVINDFGTGNFTIEAWIYMTSTSNYFYIYNSSNANFSSPNFTFLYDISLGLRMYAHAGTYTVNQGSTSGWAANTWYYVALVRNGGTITIYRNGTSLASGSTFSGVSFGSATAPLQIGGSSPDSRSNNGYIQDLRVSRYARDVTTTPTAAFPVQ